VSVLPPKHSPITTSNAPNVPPVSNQRAGNEVTLVFQDGFQLETLEEARAKAAVRKKQNQPSASSTPAAMPGNTPDMLKQLQDFRVGTPSIRRPDRSSQVETGRETGRNNTIRNS
jgi:hypothetical protein